MTVATERGGGTQLTRVRGREEKIFVTVRVRPLSAKEAARSDVSDWVCSNDHTIAFEHALPERSPFPAVYSFDRVFGPDCQTQRVYEDGAKDVALSVLTGLNSTIFAYGQTSSGKTFTMRGVTESAIADIFEYIQRDPDREFVMKVSGLEIYNEVVKDLLASDSAPLRLLDDKEKGTVVDKLKEEVVRDVSHLRQVLKICEAQRQVGETSLNDVSSRSHQIIRLTVESHPYGVAPGSPATSLLASLNFVDLAGSERASQTNADGARLKEGAHINRSLLTLSTCIRKLSGGSKTKGGHIPYRDSKLTRILQHSLGGNARTAIICTMSPAHSHVEQSRNTLAFATRAKEVTNTTQINMVVSDKVLVKQLQKEVARLEAELKVPDVATADIASSEALLQAKDLQIRKMEEELRELQLQRDAAQSRLDEVSRKLEAEELAKNQAKEAAKKLAEEATKRTPSTPGSQPILRTPLSICTNRRRWSDSGDYLIRKLEEESQQPQSPSPIRPNRPNMTVRQSTAASVLLVQEIRKLENLQDELGDDANRALEALQKEVECLRLAQAGMNHDATSTVKKLQDEIKTMHSLRATASRFKGFENKEDVASLRQSISLNPATLRQELSRLGGKDKSDADAAIATLEEQLESVQRSLDKLILANESESPKDPGDPPGTPSRKTNVPLTPSASTARQRLTPDTPCSPAARRSLRYSNAENNENAPPRTPRDNNPLRGDHGTPRGNGHHKQVASPAASELNTSQPKGSPGGAQKRSNSVDIRKMQNLFKTAAEDNIKSIRSYVTELKERVAKLQYQKQLLVCQVLELEASGTHDDEEEEDVLDDDELALEAVKSPGSWRLQFEQQRAHIVELWDICNVSIIHRTQFFLLFKGDASDAIYMEVELRRLTWLQENYNAESQTNECNDNTVEEQLIPASPNFANSVKSLKKERELLARQMARRMTNEEREDLYMRWGVPLEGKQRRLQLIYKLWMDPNNLGHVQASAEVVARIVGVINPGSAPKEMFALNFAPPNHVERPNMFGWNGLSALLNF